MTGSRAMRPIDEGYQMSPGLSDRRDYSIFYSQIEPNDLLIPGLNPGGDPAQWNESQLASRSLLRESRA